MKVNEIETRKYEGYIWLSDQEHPRVYHNEEIDFSKPIEIFNTKYDFSIENQNPFIVEALLYAKDEQISVSVKHTGKYHVNEIDLKNLPESSILDDIQYLPHRLVGVSKVNFKQLWIPEPYENCKGFDVLKMKALIYTGFTN